jgi:Protein of unknown function DUF262
MSNHYRPKKTQQELDALEADIRDKSIPYEYDTKEFPIEVVVQKFANKDLVIPDYQRDLEWKTEMKARFIESLFLGVPVPPIFVAILEDGRLEIIDGLQRIGTIKEFVENKLKLTKLEEIRTLNGFKFQDLSIPRQRKFHLLTLRFYVVTPKADLAIRADIFDRLNSTGKRLVSAQIRKGAFATNEFYIFVMQMAESEEFLQLYNGKTEEDEAHELVLRFFAYSESYEDFKHDVAIFLNRYVERKGKEGFSDEEKEIKKKDFFSMLNFVSKYFSNGFNKTANTKAIPRVRFEAISVGVHLALQIDSNLTPNYMDWLNSKEFKDETTSDASNNPGRLRRRVEFVRDCLLGIKKKESLTYKND